MTARPFLAARLAAAAVGMAACAASTGVWAELGVSNPPRVPDAPAARSAVPAGTPEPMARNLAEGWAALRNNEPAAAAQAFYKVATAAVRGPGRDEGLFWLGVAHVLEGRRGEARVAFAKYVAYAPTGVYAGWAARVRDRLPMPAAPPAPPPTSPTAPAPTAAPAVAGAADATPAAASLDTATSEAEAAENDGDAP